MYGNEIIFTSSTIQKSISLSATESKYVTFSEESKIIKWLRNVTEELGLKQHTTVMCQDNIGSIEWAQGRKAKHYSRRKHIDVLYSVVMLMIEDKEGQMKYVPTAAMKADFLSKHFYPTDPWRALATAEIFAN